VIITGAGASEDDVMLAALDAGAEDIAEQGGAFTITTAPSDVPSIRAALEEAGVPIESADTTMVASTSIELADEGSAKQVLRVIDALEDHDDVQGVYANFDIPETVLEAVMG
jgi:transcriptional/translational regulatory protein YebC/TACO1